MTNNEMDMVKSLMRLTWGRGYDEGRIGNLKSNGFKENSDYRDDYIEKLIEAAHLEVNEKGSSTFRS